MAVVGACMEGGMCTRGGGARMSEDNEALIFLYNYFV
jgi:hypothetical protein